MGDYRFSLGEHNGIPCLHVLIDPSGEEIPQTHIPLADIWLKALERGYISYGNFMHLQEEDKRVVGNEAQPAMSTIGGRPAKVLNTLTSTQGVFVQCRLPDGTDVWVPMNEIFKQFIEEVVKQTKTQQGLKQ